MSRRVFVVILACTGSILALGVLSFRLRPAAPSDAAGTAPLLSALYLPRRMVYDPQLPASPQLQRVVDCAIRALERGDAAGLCDLSGAEERARLNLTPATVGGLLRETVWRDRYPRIRTPHRLWEHEREAIWKLELGASSHLNADAYLWLFCDPEGAWRLNLSATLRSTCLINTDVVTGRQRYISLAVRHGIKGVRDAGPHSIERPRYISLQEMRAESDEQQW
jgi:hypothetical protein